MSRAGGAAQDHGHRPGESVADQLLLTASPDREPDVGRVLEPAKTGPVHELESIRCADAERRVKLEAMPRTWRWIEALVALALAGAALSLVRGGGVARQADVVENAHSALAALGYGAVGDAEVERQFDQAVAWALERARPGAAGAALARGEGGGVRWRVRFGGGGETQVTATGVAWSARRPVPTDPGPDLFPQFVQPHFEAALARLVVDPSEWRWSRSRSWREEGRLWYRAWFESGNGPLPVGWLREIEIELVGSTVVGMQRRVHPLATDLGVVLGRMAEVELLRMPASVALALLVVGILLTGAEALAYHERIAAGRGLAAGAAAAAVVVLSGAGPVLVAVEAAVVALAVALIPLWTTLPPSRMRWGPGLGVILAAVAAVVPATVIGLGGWAPATAQLPALSEPWRLFGEAWGPALLEEPLLRGALPGMLAPLLGRWGSAAIGATVGAFLHPVPAVPLVASIAAQLVLQIGMVVVSRHAGVGAAVLARGTAEALLRRSAYPVGQAWDLVAAAGALLGLVLVLWPRRRS